jgi:hypothetical protein
MIHSNVDFNPSPDIEFPYLKGNDHFILGHIFVHKRKFSLWRNELSTVGCTIHT